MEVTQENTTTIVANLRAEGQSSRAEYMELMQAKLDEEAGTVMLVITHEFQEWVLNHLGPDHYHTVGLTPGEAEEIALAIMDAFYATGCLGSAR